MNKNNSTQSRPRWQFLLTLLLFASLYSLSCQPKPGESANQNSAHIHRGVGIIQSINMSRPSVEIAHEEMKNFMPAMTMDFYVRDRSLLESLRPGDKADFTIDDTNGIQMVSEIKKR